MGSIDTDGFLDDGDWSLALPCSPPLRSYPFQDKGDTTTFLVHQRFQQAADCFVPLAALTPHPVFPAALFIEEGQPKAIGGGKIEWERTWAKIPVSRTELESFTYQFQTVTVTVSFSSTTGNGDGSTGTDGSVSSSVSVSLGALPQEVPCTVTYDYDVASRIKTTLPLSHAPRLVEVGSNAIRKQGVGSLYASGQLVVSDDPTILAENDKYGEWKGLIKVRKRREITGPTLAFWGTDLNLPYVSLTPSSVRHGDIRALTVQGVNTSWTSATAFGVSAGSLSGVSVDAASQTASMTYTAPLHAVTAFIAASDGNYSVLPIT